MKQNKLDKLLKRWAARHAADEASVRTLVERIAEQARATDPVIHADMGRRPAPSFRTKLTYTAVGIAATLVVAATIALWLRVPGNGPIQNAAALASVSAEEVESNARLFSEVKRLFGEDLRWVSNTDSEIRLGLRPVAARQAVNGTSLLIRVIVAQRISGDRAWKKVLETDILARHEELVEVVPDPEKDNRLIVWGHVLPDGNVAVDSNIQLRQPIRASIDVTNVLVPGTPTQIFSLETDDAEYRVFQVVIPLPDNGDEPCSET